MRLLLAGDIRPVHLKRYADYFKSRGHIVAVASAESDPDYKIDYKIRTVAGPGVIRYPLGIFSFQKAVREFNPDLVNCHFIPNYGLLGAMSGFHPLAVSIWGSDLLISARKTAFHLSRARRVMLAADLLLSDAEMLTRKVIELIGSKKRIITVPFGVSSDIVERGEHRKFEAKKKLKIISTRRLEKVCRVQDLINALGQIAGKVDYEAIIVGGGSQFPIIRNLKSKARLESVEMKGALPHDQVLEELLTCDLYVSCSISDSTSVSLLEAMACSVFPIVSDIEGNREWIEDGVNGLLFPVGNSDVLSEEITRAAADFDFRMQAVNKNLELIRKKAVWEDNMALVEKEFQALAIAG
jgi:glycosyltransferase involved in cell wall biosynthesis